MLFRARKRFAAVEAAAQGVSKATTLQALAKHQAAAARREGALLAALRRVAQRNEAHRLKAVELRLTRAMADHADAERSRRMRMASKQEAQLKEAFEQAYRGEQARLLAEKSAAKLAFPKPAMESIPPPPDFGPQPKSRRRGSAGHSAASERTAASGMRSASRSYSAGSKELAAERRARASEAERQLTEILSQIAADEEAAMEKASSDPKKVLILQKRIEKLLLG